MSYRAYAWTAGSPGVPTIGCPPAFYCAPGEPVFYPIVPVPAPRMTRARKDLTGLKSGMLTVISLDRIDERSRQTFWLVRCECGATKTIRADALNSGRTRSCGCLARAWSSTGNANRRHGKTCSSEWYSWQHMKSRCLNPRNKDFVHYGARGIMVCDEWINSFKQFYLDMGPAPPDGEIERKDNSKGYDKDNCIWADRITQTRNTRTNFLITYNGQTHCLGEWAEILGIDYSKLHKRLRYLGFSVERAFQK